jgi:hypothetical protein
MDLCMGNSDYSMSVFSVFLRTTFEAHGTSLAVVSISGTLEVLHIPDIVKVSQLTKVRQWREYHLQTYLLLPLLTDDRFSG